MPATKIRSKWVAGLLEFFGITTGAIVMRITESAVEADTKGAVLGSVAITKADNYALSAPEKANLAFMLTATAASKTITMGLAAGQVALAHNVGDTNAFTLKNVSGDTGTSLAAGKTVLMIGSATANGSTVIALN
jgi:hypothetical protein